MPNPSLESKTQESTFCVIPGLQDQKVIPEITVLESAKRFYQRSRLYGTPDMTGSPGNGQGLIGIMWIAKNAKGEDVIYADLLPAFNKDDNRFQTDKENIAFTEEEKVFTNEPLGGNTGRNHEQFLKLIIKRIKKALEDKDEETLSLYKDTYSR